MVTDTYALEATGGTLRFLLERMNTPFWRLNLWAIDRLTAKDNKRKPLVFDAPRA